MFYLIGLIIFCSISGIVLFAIMEALYEKKYPNKKVWYSGAFLFYVILSAAVELCKVPWVNALYAMLSLCLLSFLLYETNVKNVVINSVIIVVRFAIADLIVTTIFSLFHLGKVNINEPFFFLVSGAGNALVMLCTCKLLVQSIMGCQMNKICRRLHFYAIFLLIFELGFFCLFIKNHGEDPDNFALLMLVTGFVIVDGGILYLFTIFSKNVILEKQTELAEQQCEMTQKYYECLQNQYEETQKLIHDFKKHLQVIECLAPDQVDIKKNYTNELLNSVNSMQQQFKYEDVIVRTIIWEKIQLCEKENIKLELNLQDIKFDFMEKREVTSLFANLLDNAVEACRGSGKERKEVRLRIHSFKNHIVIGMRNTIGPAPHFREGNLQSTKQGHLGIGMKILSNLANKYCGNVNFNYSQEYFETKIILNDSCSQLK